MRKATSLSLVALFVIAAGIFVKATVPTPSIGNWQPAGSLLQPRSGAAAVLLQDGRVLITGGDGGSGPVANAEYFDTTGAFVAAPPMGTPRSGHSATIMSDGRVLIAGGNTGAGTTNAAEIFDPGDNSWTPVAGGMNESRVNHTAALLLDGRVLVAGGDNLGVPTAGVEVFDPISGVFFSMPYMTSPRTSFASGVLNDGRVLLIGGFDGSNPLSSTDIFDPISESLIPGPALSTPRMGHSATALLDGTIFVAGGNNGTVDLSSAESYDPGTNLFSLSLNSLSVARQGHIGFVLPHNNNVLIVGGTSNGSPLAAAELFVPWQGNFFATGSLAAPRVGATASAVQQDGLLLVAGGKDGSGNVLSSAEVYGFPTVRTDRSDYPPGTTVTVTGSGWIPGETITLSLVESPLVDTHGPYTALVQPDGTFSNNSFTTDQADYSIHFTLTASGSQSTISAQTAFTDAKNLNMAFAGTGSGVVTSSGGNGTINCTDTAGTAGSTGCSSAFGNTDTVTLTETPTTPSTFAGWSVSAGAVITPGTCTSSSTTCKFGMNNSTITVTATFNPGPASEYVVTSSNNSPAVGSPITITAQLADSAGNPVHTSGKIVTWSNSGAGGSFSSNPTTTNSNGVAVATFTTGTAAGTVYSFTATDNSGFTGTSGSVTTVAGALAQLVVVQQPSATAANTSINPAVQVQLQDQYGNVLSTDNGTNVAASIQTNPGGATLSGTTPVQDVNGVATFSDLSLNRVASGYTLKFNKGNTTVISAPFNITPRATTMTVALNPNSVQPGGQSQITVTVADNGAGTQSNPAGTIALSSSDIGANGDTFTSCTLAPSGGSSASCTANVTAHEVGSSPHTIAATYTPNDTLHSTSNGSAQLTVFNPATTTAVSSSTPGNASTFGDSVTFTATVSSTSGTPTGSVTFIEGASCPGSALSGSSTNPASLVAGQASFTISSLTAGSHMITGCYSPTGNFSSSNGSVTQTVARATPVITWNNPADIIYSTPLSSTQLNATASVTGTFAYAPAAGTLLGAGNGQSLHVDFTPNDTADYNTAAKNVLINVTPKPVTASITASDKIYDGTNTATITNCTIPGRVGSDDVGCSASNAAFASATASASAQNVTATVTLTGATAGNYTLAGNTTATTTAKINPKQVTPSITASDKTYDGSNAATITSCTIPGKVDTDDVGCTASNAAFASANASASAQTVSATVSLTGSTAGNYTLGGNTIATTSAKINPKPVTASITANDKTYDGSNVATVSSCTIPGKVGSDDVGCSASNAAFASANASASAQTVTATVTLTGTSAGNYALSSNTATTTASINPKPVIASITASDKTYDGSNAATISSCTIPGKVGTDDVGCSASNAAFASANASASAQTVSATVTLTGSTAGNYTLGGNITATTSAKINPKTISAALTADDKIYDGTPIEPNYKLHCALTAGSVVGTDDVACTASNGSFNSSQVATASTVTATLALTGTSAGNYALSSNSGTAPAHITTAPLTATLIAADKVYDGGTSEPDASMSCSVTPVVNGDSVTCAATNGTFNGKDVATANQVTATLTISGSPAGNYTLGLAGTSVNSTSASATALITPRTITASITADDKTYDGSSAATIHCGLAGVLAGDGANVACNGTGNFTDANVGTGKTVTSNNLGLGGSAASDYMLSSSGASTTAAILTRPLTVTLTAGDKIYDRTNAEPNARMSCTVATLISGDTVACTPTNGTFNSADVSTASQVTATVTISGTSAANYTLGTAGSQLASISATAGAHIQTAPLTASLTAADKVYDATTTESNAMSCTVVTVIAGDTVNCSATGGTFNSKDVLLANTVNATVSISGSSASNYTLGITGTFTTSSGASATAHISARPLTVSANGVNKTYDGTNTATVSLSDNHLGSDVIVDSYASANFLDKNAGANKTISVTGISISGTDAPNYALQNTSVTTSANIAPASTATTLGLSVSISTLGQSVMFTATVTNTSTTPPVPTGSVQFVVDGGNFGSAVVVAGNGSATMSTTSLAIGTHNVQAVYTNADGNFVGSNSTTVSEQVKYGFMGLQSPYAPPPMTFNVKRTMPLKWQYTNAGGAVVNSSSANPVITINGPYACNGLDNAGTITVNDAGSSGYQYDPTTNTWQFNWQVKGNLAGCYGIYIKSQQSGQIDGAFTLSVVN